MKKGLKLGVVALSLVAMASTIYTANVRADNQVKVEIIGGTNTCDDLLDYDWGQKPASLSVTPLDAISHDLVCELLASTGGNITIGLTNLLNSTIDTISNSNFEVAFGEANHDGSLTARAEVSPVTFSNAQTFYTKGQYLVGNLSGSVVLSGSIPAGKSVGVYSGTLDVSIPN